MSLSRLDHPLRGRQACLASVCGAAAALIAASAHGQARDALERADGLWRAAILRGDAAALIGQYDPGARLDLDGTEGPASREAVWSALQSPTRTREAGAPTITSCGRLRLSPDKALAWGSLKGAAGDRTYVLWRTRTPAGAWRVQRQAMFQRAANAATEPCLDAASHAFDDAQFMRDAAALKAFLTPDFRYVTGSGAVTDGASFIRDVADPDTVYDPFVIRDRTVQSLGTDGGVVSALGAITGVSGGQRFASRFRYADVFRRVGGAWKAAYVQVSPAKAEKP